MRSLLLLEGIVLVPQLLDLLPVLQSQAPQLICGLLPGLRQCRTVHLLRAQRLIRMLLL